MIDIKKKNSILRAKTSVEMLQDIMADWKTFCHERKNIQISCSAKMLDH